MRAIIIISGKSIQTLHRVISLLKLSDKIQAAIRARFLTCKLIKIAGELRKGAWGSKINE
ncbi:MAG: hypothetical protein NTX75_07060 [Proteobacteria bacterium]|nr:hypothetical protein [Pseudomonadota bacterium]